MNTTIKIKAHYSFPPGPNPATFSTTNAQNGMKDAFAGESLLTEMDSVSGSMNSHSSPEEQVQQPGGRLNDRSSQKNRCSNLVVC
jgi:hypothetical protein